MKKKKVIFIFIALFGLFFNSFVLADDDEEREVIDLTSGHSSYTLRNYTNCTIDSAISSNVNVTNEDGYAVFLKLSDPVGTTTTAGQNKTYSVTCAPIFNQGTRVQFNLEMTLVSQEEADDDSAYINQTREVTGSTLFPEYKSCRLKDTGSDYVSIQNQTNGVYIIVKKTNSIFTEKIDIACTTQQGNEATLHLKIPNYAATGTDNQHSAGKEEIPDENNTIGNGSCDFILGSINDDGTNGVASPAYVLNQVLKFIKILGPILVIALTILDLVKAVASNDKDALTKSLKILAKRMIYATLLFVFPTVLDLVLKWTNVYGVCEIFGN